MLNIMLDGWLILNEYLAGIVVFFITIYGLGTFILRQSKTVSIDPLIKILAKFSLGSIGLCVLSYLLAWLAHFLPFLLRPGSFLVLLFSVFMIILEFRQGLDKKAFSPRLLVAVMFLLLMLVARLAYLKHILLPSYSDSPIHYQIVSDILNPASGHAMNLSLDNIFQQYYHFGFHSLAAWLAAITGISPADAISLMGQLFLVILPISIVILAWHLTGNLDGALFAGLLSAVAWSMPAFAVNWGKFPALSALAVLPAFLAFLGFSPVENLKNRKILAVSLFLLVGITLLHTRIVVCVFLAVGAILLSNKLIDTNELEFFQSLRFSLLYIVSMLPIYQPIMDFYSSIPSLLVWIILLPFAFQAFPRLSLGIFLYTLGAWFIALVPPLVFENGPELIDRQFLEIMLFIPFSILGGAGFAGLMKKITSGVGARRFAALSLILFASLVFLKGDALLPDQCCLFYEEDDRLAFDWMRENTPRELPGLDFNC